MKYDTEKISIKIIKYENKLEFKHNKKDFSFQN